MTDEVLHEKFDIEALRWAIALLKDHPGVKVNLNSQMWLRRLRKMAGANEDDILAADLDNFLYNYCDAKSPGGIP